MPGPDSPPDDLDRRLTGSAERLRAMAALSVLRSDWTQEFPRRALRRRQVIHRVGAVAAVVLVVGASVCALALGPLRGSRGDDLALPTVNAPAGSSLGPSSSPDATPSGGGPSGPSPLSPSVGDDGSAGGAGTAPSDGTGDPGPSDPPGPAVTSPSAPVATTAPIVGRPSVTVAPPPTVPSFGLLPGGGPPLGVPNLPTPSHLVVTATVAGAPVEGAAVLVRNNGSPHPASALTTDANGQVTVQGVAGVWTVDISADADAGPDPTTPGKTCSTHYAASRTLNASGGTTRVTVALVAGARTCT